MGRLGGRCRARDCKAIAARDNGYTELPLDAIEMLIALAIEDRQQQVVVELELRSPLGKFAGAGRGRERGHAVTTSVIEADRLLALAAVISAGTISPIRSAAASTSTLWRYGLRPMSCPSCRPGFSKRTGRVRPMHAELKSRCWVAKRICNSPSRCDFTSSGTWHAAEAAGVPGRGEYLNEKA